MLVHQFPCLNNFGFGLVGQIRVFILGIVIADISGDHQCVHLAAGPFLEDFDGGRKFLYRSAAADMDIADRTERQRNMVLVKLGLLRQQLISEHRRLEDLVSGDKLPQPDVQSVIRRLGGLNALSAGGRIVHGADGGD